MASKTDQATMDENLTLDEVVAELKKYWDVDYDRKPGEFTAAELCEKLSCSTETGRVKLNAFEKAGIITKRKVGNRVYYRMAKKENK